MAKDKYILKKESVNGFSFANLGFFSGFASSIISTIYALVLLEIFHTSSAVGIYVAIYSAFCMIITLFVNEFFRHFSKTKLFYISMLVLSLMYFMMAFSIRPATFIVLDYATGVAAVLVGVLIPLFMADFAGKSGMAKLNGRYHFWLNLGALFAPMLAMFFAARFGNRSAFFVVAAVYALGLFFFKLLGTSQIDKKIKKIRPRKTIAAVFKSAVSFFSNPAFSRAYAVNFGRLSMTAIRALYFPIIMIEQGFSKETLGLTLTLGIVPYVILSEIMGGLARKYGTKLWMVVGFLSFAVLSFFAAFASGNAFLVLFILLQISGAITEPIADLLFFDSAKKEEQSKYIGIYKTAASIPKFIAPLIGVAVIIIFGKTQYVWAAAGIIALLTTGALLYKPRAKI